MESRSPLTPTGDTRRALGRRGEELAAEHLERLGFRVLERNVRTRRGEIDLVACDGTTLVFAEVKTTCRRGRRWEASALGAAGPLRSLGARQRVRLRGLAAVWLSERAGMQPRARTIRFDAIGVTLDREGALVELEHLEGAW